MKLSPNFEETSEVADISNCPIIISGGVHTVTIGAGGTAPKSGSGTTAISALEIGRNYLGSEINEEYYNLCKKRIESDLTLIT